MIYWKFKYSRTQRALAVGVSELSDRWYVCDCGYENDRDYNAAMNIRDCGTRLLAW